MAGVLAQRIQVPAVRRCFLECLDEVADVGVEVKA